MLTSQSLCKWLIRLIVFFSKLIKLVKMSCLLVHFFLKKEFDDAHFVCLLNQFSFKSARSEIVQCQLLSFMALVSPQGQVYRLPEKYISYTHKKTE